jgi:hypothetical protein
MVSVKQPGWRAYHAALEPLCLAFQNRLAMVGRQVGRENIKLGVVLLPCIGMVEVVCPAQHTHVYVQCAKKCSTPGCCACLYTIGACSHMIAHASHQLQVHVRTTHLNASRAVRDITVA